MMIIYKNPDDSIVMTFPARQFVDVYGEFSVATRITPKGLPFWLVEDSTIPQDMTFSEAWEVPASFGDPDGYGSASSSFADISEKEGHAGMSRRSFTPQINQIKAVVIAQKWIRSWREHWFAENDIDLQNAMADGADITPFVNRRNWLRNLPQQCEGKTIEELNDLLTDLRIGRIWDLEDDYENS